MNSLGILAALTALATAWALRAMYLDMRRAQRRADRLAARNAELRERLADAEADLELWSDIYVRAAKDRHPSAQYGGGNLRIVRGQQ